VSRAQAWSIGGSASVEPLGPDDMLGRFKGSRRPLAHSEIRRARLQGVLEARSIATAPATAHPPRHHRARQNALHLGAARQFFETRHTGGPSAAHATSSAVLL
jgi:hypothetical protein